jgi:hypothetical protein
MFSTASILSRPLSHLPLHLPVLAKHGSIRSSKPSQERRACSGGMSHPSTLMPYYLSSLPPAFPVALAEAVAPGSPGDSPLFIGL